MSTTSSRAVVYCATRESDVYDALRSAHSVRRHTPGIPVVLFTSLHVRSDVFSEVVPLDGSEANCGDKIRALIQAPFDEVLFLDADTLVLDDVSALFDLLDAFELAAALEPNGPICALPGLPSSFPEFNTGVVSLKKNAAGAAFLEEWQALYRLHRRERADAFFPTNDQPSFRQALYRSGIRFAPLAPEYNCRFRLGERVAGFVKVLHGRSADLKTVAAAANRIEWRFPWNDLPGRRWFKAE